MTLPSLTEMLITVVSRLPRCYLRAHSLRYLRFPVAGLYVPVGYREMVCVHLDECRASVARMFDVAHLTTGAGCYQITPSVSLLCLVIDKNHYIWSYSPIMHKATATKLRVRVIEAQCCFILCRISNYLVKVSTILFCIRNRYLIRGLQIISQEPIIQIT